MMQFGLASAAVLLLGAVAAGAFLASQDCQPPVVASLSTTISEPALGEATSADSMTYSFAAEGPTLSTLSIEFWSLQGRGPEGIEVPRTPVSDLQRGAVQGVHFQDAEPTGTLSDGDSISISPPKQWQLRVYDAQGTYLGGSAPFENCPPPWP